MTRYRVSLGVYLAFLFSACASSSFACDFPPRGYLHEPRIKFTGFYQNDADGYSVVIPNHVAGYDPNLARHSGFGIPLGEQSQSFVLVQADPNSLEDAVPIDTALRLLRYMREEKKTIESLHIQRSHLGSLEAAEMLVTYTCLGSAKRYTMVAVIAIGPGKDPVYEAILYCPASRYLDDRRVFDQLLKSWKYTGY
jgi:hypothetical protein